MAVQTLRTGDVVARQYEIESKLGTGPVGTTYSARIISNNRKVALKVLHGPAAEASVIQAVASATRKVQHEGLVPLLDVITYQGQTVAIYEYVQAESLRTIMDTYTSQRRSFSLQEAGQILVKILETIDKAHASGIVHLHLKPANVLVSTRYVGPGQGRPMHSTQVLGLGLSGLIHPSVLAANLSESPDQRYVAPDAGATTRQADLYSAGVIFYELLTGQTPMGSYLSPSQIRDDLPTKVDDIIDIALAANAEDRYPTARDMINVIQRLFQNEEEQSAGIPKKTIAMLIGGVAILATIGIATLMLSDPEKELRNKDAELRASVVKSNTMPSDDTIQNKLALHPDMVWVPEGSFIRGRMNAEKIAPPNEAVAEVKKISAYYIDRFEWNNTQGGNPLVKVTWEQAKARCEEAGKRLCTALEWERACKGPESFVYPYGDNYAAESCGSVLPGDSDKNGESDHVSGSLADCKSKFGVFDMSGGPREWTGNTMGTENGKPRLGILKGGRKDTNADVASRCAYEYGESITKSDSATSFRCCLDDGPASAPPTTPPVPTPAQ